MTGKQHRAEPFPLIVGVTGHRDIPPEARETLRKTVRNVLQGLSSAEQFGADAVCVLSALAQGADQLVAEVALELGLRLIAVSPMPLDDYRATLQDDPEAAERFEEYWRRAALQLVLPWVDENEQTRDHKLQYEQLGGVLSRYSHLLLALWDGQKPWDTLTTPEEQQDARGGTSHVLHMRHHAEREAEGFRSSPLFKDASSRLDLARGGPVLHVVTQRIKTHSNVASGGLSVVAGDCVVLPPYAVGSRVLTAAEQVRLTETIREDSAKEFQRLRELNTMLRGFGRVEGAKHAKQIGFLLPSDPAMDPPGAARDHIGLLRTLQAGADAAAQRFQRRLFGEFVPATGPGHMLRNGWKVLAEEWRLPAVGMVSLFTTLVVATVIWFEIYAHVPHAEWAILPYLLMPLIGLALYRCLVRRGEWQNQFQDYRALAEAMRVQIAWAGAAMPRGVADHYLRLQRDELGWIQFALRGPALWAAALALELPGPLRPLVNERWIEDQCVFFLGRDGRLGKSDLNQIALKRSQAWTKRFGFSSLGLSGLLLVMELAKLCTEHAARFTVSDQIWHWLRDGLLVLTATAGGIAATFALSAERRAYEAHGHSYLALGHIFAKARTEAERDACAKDDEEYKKLIFDLGREALAENAAWLQDHRRRPIEHHPHGGG